MTHKAGAEGLETQQQHVVMPCEIASSTIPATRPATTPMPTAAVLCTSPSDATATAYVHPVTTTQAPANAPSVGSVDDADHKVVPCDSVTPTTQVMHPASTTTGAAATISPSHLDATALPCIQSATRTQMSHRHACKELALTSGVPSKTIAASVETDQQVMSGVVEQPGGALQAVMATIQACLPSGIHISISEPGVGPMSTTGTEHCSLLALLNPGPIRMHFKQQLDSASALSLFGTCTVARDMVLDESRNITLKGHLLSDQAQHHLLTALQLANRHPSSISLVLNKSDRACMRQGLSRRSYALLQAGHSMGILERVSKLELANVYLESLFPSVLRRVLPNLKVLGLHCVVVKFKYSSKTDHLDAVMPSFPGLQTLQLQHVEWDGPIKRVKQQLLQQVAQLSSLNSLSLTDLEWQYGAWWESEFLAVHSGLVMAAARQLTHLELDCYTDGAWCAEEIWRKPGLSTCLSAVQSLELGFEPGDDELSQLFALPSLTHLSIPGLQITQSFAEHHSRWQVLEMSEVCLQDLAWLPLHADLLIKGQAGGVLRCYNNPRSEATLEEARAHIARSGWPGWHGSHVNLHLEPYYGEAEEILMVQALPLLAGTPQLSLDEWQLSAVGLGALVDFATNQRHGFHLQMHSRCTWSLTDMLALLSRMPASSHLTVVDPHTETFTQLCIAAKGRIVMHVRFTLRAEGGFGMRLMAALASCGQRALVTDLGKTLDVHDFRRQWEWVVEGASINLAATGTAAAHSPPPSDATAGVQPATREEEPRSDTSAHAASTAADQQQFSVGVKPTEAAHAAVVPARNSTAPGNQTPTKCLGVNHMMVADTAAICSCSRTTPDKHPPLLTTLKAGPYLLQFKRQLDRASMLALFGTCTVTRDMVLREAHSITVGGHVLEHQAHQHLLTALQLASKHSQNISLVLNKSADEYKPVFDPAEGPEKESCWPGRCTPELVKAQKWLSTHSYALVEEGRRLGVLQGVTNLELTGVYLESPLPAVLGYALPNLKALALCRGMVRFNEQDGTANMDVFMPAYPRLQTLALHDVGWSGPINDWQQQLSQQCSQLPALTSLSLTISSYEFQNLRSEEDEIDTAYGALYGIITEAVVESAAGQLTHLQLDWYDEPDEEGMLNDQGWSKLEIGSRLSAVRSLRLAIKLQDADMVQLLALPCLTHLFVLAFELTRSFAGHQCCWQVLELRELGIQEIAWLPLHAGLVIKAPSDMSNNQGPPMLCFNIYPPSKATVDEAMTNIAQAAWPGWRNMDVRMTTEWTYDGHVRTCVSDIEVLMVQALPLLAGVSVLLVDDWHLGAAGLEALGDFAANQQHGFHLEVHGSCTCALADMLTLVSRMPGGSHLTVAHTTTETFTQLCCAAQGGVTMHARLAKQAKDGFGEALKGGLASRGLHDAVVADLGMVPDRTGWRWSWEWVVNGHERGV